MSRRSRTSCTLLLKIELLVAKGRKLVTFEPSDLVWLHLHNDRFPALGLN
jgi:hypothetical protein